MAIAFVILVESVVLVSVVLVVECTYGRVIWIRAFEIQKTCKKEYFNKAPLL